MKTITRIRKIGQIALAVPFIIAALLLGTGEADATHSQTITAKALIDHECDSTEWHFVIVQVASQDQAPPSILVTWSDNSEAVVVLDKYTGKTAHYTTTLHLDLAVVRAEATIYGSWSGQFNLSHGPCEPTTPPEECPEGTRPIGIKPDGSLDCVPDAPPTTEPPTTPTTEPPSTTVTFPDDTATSVVAPAEPVVVTAEFTG